MSDFDLLSFIYLLMAAILPISALIGRKLEWRKGVVMALAWASIFAVVTAFVSIVQR